MKPVKLVKRNFGWFHRKHGIWLDPLPPSYQKFLIDNDYLKKVTDDLQTLQIVLHVFNMEQCQKRSRKVWYDPYMNRGGTYEDIEHKFNQVKWRCAICGSKITADMYSISPKNLCCKKCVDDYCKPRQRVDNRIVKSSIKFNEHCKKLLKFEQKLYLKYLKRNTLLKV